MRGGQGTGGDHIARLLEQQGGGANRTPTPRVQVRDQRPAHACLFVERLGGPRGDRRPLRRGEPAENGSAGQRVSPTHVTVRLAGQQAGLHGRRKPSADVSGIRADDRGEQSWVELRAQHGGGANEVSHARSQPGDPVVDQSGVGGRRFADEGPGRAPHVPVTNQCTAREEPGRQLGDHQRCTPEAGPGGHVGMIRASTDRNGDTCSSSASDGGATRTSASATGRNDPHRAPHAPTLPGHRRLSPGGAVPRAASSCRCPHIPSAGEPRPARCGTPRAATPTRRSDRQSPQPPREYREEAPV